MPISSFQFELVGAKFPVEGPLTSGQQFSVKPGTLVSGDNGGEFLFLTTDVVTAYTANQGDAFIWDASLVASRSGETVASSDYLAGTNVGTLFLGGQTGIGSSIRPWTFSFLVGRYGIWVQRAGASLLQVNSVAQPIVPRTPSTSLPGRLTFATAATAGYNLIAPGTISLRPLTRAFTADTLSGSNVMLNCSTARALEVGLRITGTGIPGPTTAASTYITGIDGPTITISQAATASNVGTTITAASGITSGTTTSGSPLLTVVPTIVGIYPGQTITGTGIPSTTHILAITGASPSYTIVLDANCTATASNILFTATSAAVPNYAEVMLNWPYFSADTV